MVMVMVMEWMRSGFDDRAIRSVLYALYSFYSTYSAHNTIKHRPIFHSNTTRTVHLQMQRMQNLSTIWTDRVHLTSTAFSTA